MIFSIGMPVYNGEKFLVNSLESILNQTYIKFELIIADNASQDSTQEICERYSKQDSRIQYFRHKKNFGAMYNFKFVLEKSKGDFFMWAASDDKWSKNWIESLLPIAIKSNCLAYGKVITIDKKNEIIKNPSSNKVFNFNGLKFFRRLHYYISNPAFGKANPFYGIIPRSILIDKLDDFSLVTSKSGDMVFLYQLLELVEIKGSNIPILYKRIHSGAAGGGDIIKPLNIELKRIHSMILKFIHSIIIERFEHHKIFSMNSRVEEKIIITLLFPILILTDSIQLLKWHAKNRF